MKSKHLLFFIFLASGIPFTATICGQQQDQIFIDVDVSARYPGGVNAFQEFVLKNAVYPTAARKNGIEGMTYVEFVITRSGRLDTSSVAVIKGAHPLLDAEAIRAVKLCNLLWTPGEKNGKTVSQKIVLPVDFKLKPIKVEQAANGNLLKKPIRTVTVAKTFKSVDPTHWVLYSTRNLQDGTGRIAIGDNVEVLGWAAWAFFIRTQGEYGYVSWKSLKITDELDSLAKVVAESSSREQERQKTAIDSTYNKIAPIAHLSLLANKKSIYIGECVTLTLAFNVAHNNPVRLQFQDLGKQLGDLLSNELDVKKCWQVSSNITEVIGEATTIGKDEYTTYKIYEAAYCPSIAERLVVPALRLYIGRLRPGERAISDSVNFYSKQLSINVLPLPLNRSVTTSDGYPLVGKFKINESISKESVAVGETSSYRVTISGKGLTFPIEPPKIQIDNIISRLREIVDSDTLIGGELSSRKTFIYDLVPKKPGVYAPGNSISFTYFDKDTKKGTVLKGSKTIAVSDRIITAKYAGDNPFDTKNSFIAFDASTSMQIEDYEPFRLAAVKKGIEEFLKDRQACDIGLIAFGGEAKHLVTSGGEGCYPLKSLADFDFNQLKKGTAMGDVIWLAKNSFANNTMPKRLVIIGDGDNTAGHLSPKFAAELAKKYNIKIFAIGVGHKGFVKFGIDQYGKPNLIDDTYSDNDFKIMTSITGGQFYHAKDHADVTRILNLIFKN